MVCHQIDKPENVEDFCSWRQSFLLVSSFNFSTTLQFDSITKKFFNFLFRKFDFLSVNLDKKSMIGRKKNPNNSNTLLGASPLIFLKLFLFIHLKNV